MIIEEYTQKREGQHTVVSTAFFASSQRKQALLGVASRVAEESQWHREGGRSQQDQAA